MTSKSIQAVAGVTAVLFLSKVLGLVREMVIAAQFGTSADYDLFLIGIIVPALLSGVLGFASYYWLVPYFSRVAPQGDDRNLWKAVWQMLSGSFLLGLTLSVAVALAAPVVMRLWAGDVSGEDYRLVVFFARLTAAIILFAAVEALLRAALHVRGRIISPAAGLVLFNSVSILLMLLFSDRLGATAVGIGMIGGFVAQIGLLVIRLMSAGAEGSFSPKLPVAWPDGIARAAGLLVSIELINRSYFMIDRYFAPKFGEGVVSALNYAQVLALLPDSVIGVSIAAIVFPVFSRAAEGDRRAFAESFGRSIVAGLVLAVPMALVAAFAAPEIIHLVFQRGAFTEASVQLTSLLFVPLTPVIASTIVATLSLRACYAFGWYFPVLMVTAVLFVLKGALTVLLIGTSGESGIALATTISQICFAMFLLGLVFVKVPELRQGKLGLQLVRVLASGLVTVSVMVACDRTIESACPGELSLSIAITRLTLTTVITGGIFLGALFLFGLGPTLKSFLHSSPALTREGTT